MSSSILERNDILANRVWGSLHRAGLDNVHIDMCLEDVVQISLLNESDRNREEVRETLLRCDLPQIPLDQVMGVLFPQETISKNNQLGYAP